MRFEEVIGLNGVANVETRYVLCVSVVDETVSKLMREVNNSRVIPFMLVMERESCSVRRPITKDGLLGVSCAVDVGAAVGEHVCELLGKIHDPSLSGNCVSRKIVTKPPCLHDKGYAARFFVLNGCGKAGVRLTSLVGGSPVFCRVGQGFIAVAIGGPTRSYGSSRVPTLVGGIIFLSHENAVTRDSFKQPKTSKRR